ncbi:MAG: hypothetical protein KAI73_01010, partial [Rhodospirillaceae bacterium]|nr:hypothetical protein [Rhodospirillaceae bacterium]
MKIIRVKKRADRVIEFIEKLIIPSGKGQGEPFKLIPEHKKFIRDIYEPHAMIDGELKRVVRNAILSIARKNAKTTLIACLVLVHIVGPEAETNNEIFSAANDKDQAAQVFKVAAQIILASPELSRILKVVGSTKTIACYGNGTQYQALSREAGTKHGKNPGLVIYDELAQAKDMELFETLDSAMGARLEPLMVVISTQSKDPEHILSQMIDDGLNANDPTIVCHLYAVPDDCEDIYDEKVWKLANPALGKFLRMDYMRAKAARAKRMPSFENSFMNLHLNMRVDSTPSLISRQEWMGCLDPDCELEPGEDIYLGLDLSAKIDLTALIALSANNGDRITSWFWKPQEYINEHQKRDRAPYDKWIKEGHLIAVPGKVIDFLAVAIVLQELDQNYNIIGLSFDDWRMKELLKDCDSIGVAVHEDGEIGDGIRLCPFRQGFKSFAPAIDALEESIIAGEFRHDGNPVLTWNFSN